MRRGGQCPRCLLPAGGFAIGDGGAGGRDSAPVPAEEINAYLPDFEVEEIIGYGGMGAVYKACQTRLNRDVAIKILPMRSRHDPTFVERFHREAQAMAQLNHPNIVTIYDYGEADELLYLVMEFVDGVNLAKLIKSGRISASEALAVVPPICDALQYAHGRGIVHRDIKPSNILLDKSGAVKITDFGLAKLIDAGTEYFTLTREGHSLGTPFYMAPEQLEHPESADHRADIYSLGVVFYEMLTGQLPAGKFAPPSQRANVDVRLDQVVLKALEAEPDLRYQHASELRTGVEEVTGTAMPPPEPARSPPPAPLPSPIPMPPSPERHRDRRVPRAVWASLVTAAVMAAAWLGYDRWGGGTETDSPEQAETISTNTGGDRDAPADPRPVPKTPTAENPRSPAVAIPAAPPVPTPAPPPDYAAALAKLQTDPEAVKAEIESALVEL